MLQRIYYRQLQDGSYKVVAQGAIYSSDALAPPKEIEKLILGVNNGVKIIELRDRNTIELLLNEKDIVPLGTNGDYNLVDSPEWDRKKRKLKKFAILTRTKQIATITQDIITLTENMLDASDEEALKLQLEDELLKIKSGEMQIVPPRYTLP